MSDFFDGVLGETLVLKYEEVEIYNLESGAWESLTSPDSVTFKWRSKTGSSVTQIAGNQEGSTNTWNAEHTVNVAGDFVWWCEVVKGASKGVTKPTRVKVNAQ